MGSRKRTRRGSGGVLPGAAALGAAAVGAGAVGVLRRRRGGHAYAADPEGWKSVTVLADAEAIAPGGAYPAPLAAMADRLQLRLQPATRDRGTEVHARFRSDARPDPEALRAALRDAKALVETGIVQASKPRPHGHRPSTLAGAAVDRAEDAGKGTGLL